MSAEKIVDTRITGGLYRGRKIESPHSELTHPMGSRERLAIMNSLGARIAGVNIVDAYAGSGALGIEALSRGANHVTFIEKNHKVANVLKNNLKNLGVDEDKYTVVETSVNVYGVQNADVVIFDPPYDKINEFIKSFSEIFENFKSATTFVISYPKGTELKIVELGNFACSTRTYAGANISIFTK